MLIRLLFKGRNFSRRPHAFFRHNLAGQSLSPLLVPSCHLQSKDNLLRRGAPTSPSPWPPGLSPSPRPTWATGWGRGGKAPSQHQNVSRRRKPPDSLKLERKAGGNSRPQSPSPPTGPPPSRGPSALPASPSLSLPAASCRAGKARRPPQVSTGHQGPAGTGQGTRTADGPPRQVSKANGSSGGFVLMGKPLLTRRPPHGREEK